MKSFKALYKTIAFMYLNNILLQCYEVNFELDHCSQKCSLKYHSPDNATKLSELTCGEFSIVKPC